MVWFIRGLAVTSTISLLSVKYFSVDGFLFYHAEILFSSCWNIDGGWFAIFVKVKMNSKTFCGNEKCALIMGNRGIPVSLPDRDLQHRGNFMVTIGDFIPVYLINWYEIQQKSWLDLNFLWLIVHKFGFLTSLFQCQKTIITGNTMFLSLKMPFDTFLDSALISGSLVL